MKAWVVVSYTIINNNRIPHFKQVLPVVKEEVPMLQSSYSGNIYAISSNAKKLWEIGDYAVVDEAASVNTTLPICKKATPLEVLKIRKELGR